MQNTTQTRYPSSLRPETRYSFTRVSGNSKTGPIPVVSSTSNTCPDVCPLKGEGCYAELGMVGMNWRKLDKKPDAIDLQQLAGHIQALPKGTFWRMNVAGDLTYTQRDNGQVIDWLMLQAIIAANQGKQGFTYTHHDMQLESNRSSVQQANARGFTINLSANNLGHADELLALGIAPVVTILPEDYQHKNLKTPAGNAIVVCPAVTTESMTCDKCKLCAKPDRKSIVGFPVHGTSKNKAYKVFMMHKEKS